jgi:hypothetical protein
MGLNQEYVLTLINEGIKGSVTWWNLDINKNSVKPTSTGHIWATQSEWFKVWAKEFIVTNGYLNPNDFKFQAQVNVLPTSVDDVLNKIKVQTNGLKISYEINRIPVSYVLDDVSIEWCDLPTLWVKVIWNVQWSWVNQSAGLEKNFSDLSKSETRAKIRQNAYTLTRNIKSESIVNWVKYVKWDVTINLNNSWDNLWYETLVVENWNVIITGSGKLNPSKSKLWIIVLKDSYDVTKDWKTQWNVYVWKDVTEINAIIYADWALRSADEKGNSYSEGELLNKLSIYGTLFTRNTIWWIIWWLVLPGWQKTDNYDLAKTYDLNFLRNAKNANCDPNFYSVQIQYNPSITTNPPKWFSSN